jgi:hypothetical protein
MKRSEYERGILGKISCCWSVEKTDCIFQWISEKRIPERYLLLIDHSQFIVIVCILLDFAIADFQ